MAQINVLYCFDTKFWRMAAVSMQTLLASANKDAKIKIYTMVAPHTHGYRKIKKMLAKHVQSAGLEWHVVKDSENPFVGYEYSRWSPVIWYRLFAHRVFKDIDKLLYLDSDTLICKDVSELFNTDLDGYCLGAVRDMAPSNDPYHPQGIFVKNFSNKYLNSGTYHNSGVLLLNLAEMERNENLLLNTKIPLFYPDQDLLNAALCGKIKTLPLKYNLAPGIKVPKIFEEGEAREALYGGHVIVHCYSVKPYYADRAPDAIYAMFSTAAKAIGMNPADFVKWEKKWTRKRKTFIPHIKIQNNYVWLFGMRIKI